MIPATPAFRGRDVRNHRYLYVDFPSPEEAKRAVKAMDGRYAWGVKLRVRIANGDDSRKTRDLHDVLLIVRLLDIGLCRSHPGL